MAENDLDASQIPATGPRGNITKQDAVVAAQGGGTYQGPQSAAAPAGLQEPQSAAKVAPAAAAAAPAPSGPRAEQRVPMTRIRARIAERLKEVQNTAALLTTFNEVNMQPSMDLRKKYQDQFVAKHGVKLGFMSLFVRAATEALKAFPLVNASIDGKDIVYHGFYDIGIAVASDRGLVVPILRDTEQMSLATIEKEIAAFAGKARNGKLTMEDMSGGTFSITNGGTFGSMMSTPIINAPQSAILGMHNIIERPIAQNGQVVIAPDDVPRPELRPPHHRRQGSRAVPGDDQEPAGRPGPDAAGTVKPAQGYSGDGPAVRCRTALSCPGRVLSGS